MKTLVLFACLLSFQAQAGFFKKKQPLRLASQVNQPVEEKKIEPVEQKTESSEKSSEIKLDSTSSESQEAKPQESAETKSNNVDFDLLAVSSSSTPQAVGRSTESIWNSFIKPDYNLYFEDLNEVTNKDFLDSIRQSKSQFEFAQGLSAIIKKVFNSHSIDSSVGKLVTNQEKRAFFKFKKELSSYLRKYLSYKTQEGVQSLDLDMVIDILNQVDKVYLVRGKDSSQLKTQFFEFTVESFDFEILKTEPENLEKLSTLRNHPVLSSFFEDFKTQNQVGEVDDAKLVELTLVAETEKFERNIDKGRDLVKGMVGKISANEDAVKAIDSGLQKGTNLLKDCKGAFKKLF